jgi:tRNA-specific 2-thiouridylase
VVDVDGTEVGEHFGAAGYTVGQRHGVGVALGEVRYVSEIDAAANKIRLGRREDLLTRTFEVERMQFVAGAPEPAAPFRARVQIRHGGRTAPASSRPAEDGRWIVETEEAVWAAAPGQAAVFYRDDAVVGGGRIVQRVRSDRPVDLSDRSVHLSDGSVGS